MSERKIEEIVERTFNLSKDYKHQYVQIEHLLAIILETEEVEDILLDLGVQAKAVSRQIYDYLEKELESSEKNTDPKKTLILERVFHRPLTQAIFN